MSKVKVVIFISGVLILLILSVISIKANEEEDDFIYETKLEDTIYSSNRYTSKDEVSDYKANDLVTLDDYKYVVTSKNISMYVNESNLSLRLVNNENGFIWGSSFNTENENLNKTWKSRVESGIWITYYKKGIYRDEAIDETITSSGKTKILIDYKYNGFEANIDFGQSRIKMRFVVKLEDGILKVLIPTDSIIENETNVLGYIKVFPFFGAVKATEEKAMFNGYTLIPDGSGSLIRYNKKSKSPYPIYSKFIYGEDIGIYDTIDNQTLYDDTNISLPIFGIVQGINQNAMYCEAKNGEEYSRIISYQSGRTTDFYWTLFEYIYRIQYNRKTSQQTSVISTQKERNIFDLELEYSFLNDNKANYVGIANNYREKLIENKEINCVKNENVKLHLEILMSEVEKGLIFNKYVNMTSTDYIEYIINDLLQSNINNISVSLKGWSKKGYTGTSPDYFGFNKKTGGRKGYLNLFDYFKTNNIDYYLVTNYLRGYSGSNGFSQMSDIVQKITGEAIKKQDGDYEYTYVNPSVSSEILLNDLANYYKYNINGIAFEEIGSLIYSSWDNDHKMSLTQTINEYKNMLNISKINKSIYNTNKYSLQNVTEVYDVPMYSSQIGLFTDTIPFVSLVLKNTVLSYGPIINNFSDIDDEVLRLIDYNLYPSILITENSCIELINTSSNNITSSKYQTWSNKIKEIYQKINTVLLATNNSNLLNREIITSGVVKNTYDNGIIVYINYLNKDIVVDNISLLANDFYVVK